jgi:hypothetical protein
MLRNTFVRSGPGYVMSRTPVANNIEVDIDHEKNSEPLYGITGTAGILGIVTFILTKYFPGVFTPDVMEWVNVLWMAGIPLAIGFIGRRYVWSPASVKRVLDFALQEAESSAKK